MLLFISWSCCSRDARSLISIHLMLLFIGEDTGKLANYAYFNTSHVTVYQKQKKLKIYELGFQYISCYCLSKKSCRTAGSNTISIHLMLLFIIGRKRNLFDALDFNTSHVTVYLWSIMRGCRPVTDFNTSHVTVYLVIPMRSGPVNNISIHLMLLFIFIFCAAIFPFFRFQYISCYCLSSAVVSFSPDSSLFQYISCYCLSSESE